MKSHTATPRFVTLKDAFAVAHGQAVFRFQDAIRVTAFQLGSVLVWAAARTASLSHAVERLYPGFQDQTFWNLLRRHLPKQAPALERRLNELLRRPAVLPRLAGRSLAVDTHVIPYCGAPKKVDAN